MKRAIYKLESAHQLDGWPDMIPRARPRGIKAFGSRYEKTIEKHLGTAARRGVWWSYRDSYGPGLCQTDFFLLASPYALILEAKHTWTPEGIEQLRDLYLPVVEMALSRRVLGIQICKNLVPYVTGQVYDDLADAAAAASRSREIVTFHWRAVSPMLAKGPLTWEQNAVSSGLLPRATI